MCVCEWVVGASETNNKTCASDVCMLRCGRGIWHMARRHIKCWCVSHMTFIVSEEWALTEIFPCSIQTFIIAARWRQCAATSRSLACGVRWCWAVWPVCLAAMFAVVYFSNQFDEIKYMYVYKIGYISLALFMWLLRMKYDEPFKFNSCYFI